MHVNSKKRKKERKKNKTKVFAKTGVHTAIIGLPNSPLERRMRGTYISDNLASSLLFSQGLPCLGIIERKIKIIQLQQKL